MTSNPAMQSAEWPSGPLYTEWVGAEGFTAWPLFKLSSADWYVDRLEEVGARVGFGRYVGVEMALDGALAALSGAFDASIAAVMLSTERYSEQAEVDGRGARLEVVPSHSYSWTDRGRKKPQPPLPGARSRLQVMDGELDGVDVAGIVSEVDAALERTDARLGWLSELRLLRNRSVHQDTLARHIDASAGGEHNGVTFRLTVGGTGEHPVEYLKGARERVAELIHPLLAVCDHLCPLGVPTSRPANA